MMLLRKLFFLIPLVFSFYTNAQDSTLVIGIKEAPPFVHIEDNEPEGLSIEFWELLQEDLPYSYKFRIYNEIPDLIEAVEKGEVDFSINPITVTDRRMQTIDFSQPFFISGTAMAQKNKSVWLGVIKNMFTWQFFSTISLLLLLLLIIGFLVWIFERKRNSSQFDKSLRGIADGFWWSAVTMTTVGYGDKAPVTGAGRFIGFIWMFAAIILISSLTAGIASALTVHRLESRIASVEDLRRFKVGSIVESSSAVYLKTFNVISNNYHSVEEGLKAVANDELDVFIYDRPILQEYINKLNLKDLSISTKDLKTDYYSFSFKKGNKLLDKIDPLVVRALKSQEWNYKLSSIENRE